METIFIWRWKRDPFKIILDKSEPFLGSETFSQEWEKIGSFKSLNPLRRPIPKDFKLFVAERSETFPYDSASVVEVDNLFYPLKKGLYYIAPKDHWRLKDIQNIKK